MVSNNTLAQLSIRYGLPDRLIAAHGALYVTRAQQKTKANLFESHVAGVFYSYLQAEVTRGPSTISVIMPSQQGSQIKTVEAEFNEEDDSELEESEEDDVSEVNVIIQHVLLGEDAKQQLIPPTHDLSTSLPHSIDKSKTDATELCTDEKKLEPLVLATESVAVASASEDSSPHTSNNSSVTIKPGPNHPSRGQAFDYLDTWLRPLYVPLAHWALEECKKEQARLDSLGTVKKDLWEGDKKMIGARGILSQHVIDQMKGPAPSYHSFEDGIGSWKVVCKVMNKIGEEW